ncbi:MAG: sterol desaturase family protein [Bacteroidetes bacterium]|nr:sterol desaturase family protein [Bacteroidota bacterium]MDA1121124.1 sterol desaturase family protein [Bacteroidota bacterium]
MNRQIPTHLMPQAAEKGELFHNKSLEKLTRTSIEVPVMMHTMIAVAFLYFAFTNTILSHGSIILLFFSGLIFWTLAEYVVHRWGYHTHTTLKWWLDLQHLAHGIHHQYPRDPKRLAMPPFPALLLISLFFGLFWLIGEIYSIAFFPGFLIGYMLYISLHYAQHRFKTPKFQPFKNLWKHHALHHYKYPETKAFGVSTRLWDFVFGTLPNKSPSRIIF